MTDIIIWAAIQGFAMTGWGFTLSGGHRKQQGKSVFGALLIFAAIFLAIYWGVSLGSKA